jgi:protein SSD1
MGDLAQAQAQLQSLQQFRAAAGGHHQKMPSFSFPNMLPNVMAANMMGINPGGYNLLQQQHQQFQVGVSSLIRMALWLMLCIDAIAAAEPTSA